MSQNTPSSNKRFTQGSHRICPPAETIQRITPYRETYGITRVANVTGLDTLGIHVASICRPNARSLATTQGKGLTLEAAVASGLMEAIEFAHAETPDLPMWRYSYAELTQKNDPVLQHRALLAAPQQRIHWLRGIDLLNHRTPIWIPYGLVHLDLALPLIKDCLLFPPNSNGLASGNNDDEAICHSICELIERDAWTLWQTQRERFYSHSPLDLTTLPADSDCRSLVDRYLAQQVDIEVWDITSDIGIAAFHCSINGGETAGYRSMFPAIGVGCHPCREIALTRALTEAAQSRLTLIGGTRDDRGRPAYARLLDKNSIEPSTTAPASGNFQATPNQDSATIAQDCAHLYQALRRRGANQVAMIKLSADHNDFSVVRVVIPALEGIRDAPGYVPGPRALQYQESVAS